MYNMYNHPLIGKNRWCKKDQTMVSSENALPALFAPNVSQRVMLLQNLDIKNKATSFPTRSVTQPSFFRRKGEDKT